MMPVVVSVEMSINEDFALLGEVIIHFVSSNVLNNLGNVFLKFLAYIMIVLNLTS